MDDGDGNEKFKVEVSPAVTSMPASSVRQKGIAISQKYLVYGHVSRQPSFGDYNDVLGVILYKTSQIANSA